jgi:hypothetical protein
MPAEPNPFPSSGTDPKPETEGPVHRARPGVRHGLCRLALLGAALTVALTMAGCGGDSPAAGDDATEPAAAAGGEGVADAGETSRKAGDCSTEEIHIPDVPLLCVEVKVSGAVSIDDKVATLVPTMTGVDATSCADFAKGSKDPDDGSTILSLPNFLSGGEVGGHRLLLGAHVKDYGGPGTYDKTQLTGPGGAAFSIDDNAYAPQPDKGTADVKVEPNGSGTFTFTEFALSGASTIEGSLTWSCFDA